MRTIAICAGLMLLAACSPRAENAMVTNIAAGDNLADADVTEVPDETAPANAGEDGDGFSVDEWNGKWTGVEGLALVIARGKTPETRNLTITLMDGTKSYVGTVEGDTIRFQRDGKAETIHAGTGEETGLKWLGEKQNCLIIKQGEGFCR